MRVFREAKLEYLTEMRQELAKQWTPQIAIDLQRYAELRASIVKKRGIVCPRLTDYARELIHDAYVDTWSGERSWDHKRYSLLDHLRGVIMSRTWNEVRSARQFVSLDAPAAASSATNENAPSSDDSAALVDRFSSSSGDVGAVAFPAIVERLCNELSQVTEDRDCLVVARAWQRGFIQRDEVMEVTALSEQAYRRARRRLVAASENLPDELRELVRDYLRSAS